MRAGQLNREQQRAMKRLQHNAMRARMEGSGKGSGLDSKQLEQDSWMVAYLDLMSLLLAFFVIMGALSHAKAGVNLQGKERDIQSQSTPGKPVSMDASVKRQGQKSGMSEAMQRVIGSNSLGGLVDVHVDPGQIRLQMNAQLLFAPGSDQLKPAGLAAVHKLVKLLLDSGSKIDVEGHSDNIPINTARFHSNWALAAARAVSVVEELINAGIPTDRLHASSYGDTRPIASNGSPEGRAKNRRVEFVLEMGQEFIHQRKRQLQESGADLILQ
ncbi:MAG: flagellar motor protein MotB [Mariprofundales bacterium]|nr:flagellar motor protein MotB [Mariprofundales bacterium]